MSSLFFNIEDVKNHPHHPAMNDLTDILCHRTGNVNREFFQVEIAYFLGLIPSSQRATIKSPERGIIPINIYSIALATSGFGKGHSVSLMENVISEFRKEFTHNTLPKIAEKSIFDLAVQIAAAKGGNEDTERELLTNDYKRQGHTPFLFDSGTGPAVKQLRYKLLLAKAGSINFQMDEIGSNLINNAEVLNILLELYDLGHIKTKLIKNTQDNERGMDILGSTPANALMFGTTSKLLDGSKTEEEFFSFLETGYARRCFFGVGKPVNMNNTVSPEDVYDGLVSKNKSQAIELWTQRLGKFADPKYYNKAIDLPKQVGVSLVSYRLYCEAKANNMPEHEVIKKAELSHRYFKALKLAGVYAFLDENSEVTKENLLQAIKVCEESGKSFQTLLKRERNFVRLAKYIASSPDNLTHADLVEDLPYYPNGAGPRREIMDLTMAWAVSNHMVIKKDVVQGIEFFSGSKLQETDMDKLSFSFSEHFASDYEKAEQPFDSIPKLLKAPGYHWCNHAFENKHRLEDNVIQGFNLIVLDIDKGISLKACQELLKDYSFITATTKRHNEDENRFRLIMPTNYILELNRDDYREFMESFLLWLPFTCDEQANQRSRKWMTNENSEIMVHHGKKVLDVLPFIPKTKQNNEYTKTIADLGHLDNLERWFLNQMNEGNRNNTLLNFGMMLKDAGMLYGELKDKIVELNSKSTSPLKRSEIESTVFKSIAQKMET